MAIKEFKINSQSYINRHDETLARYLRQMNHYKQITPEEETELSATIRKGGKEAERAKECLVKANLRFVVSVANTYSQCGVPMLDLIAEGNIGLLHAAEFFDGSRGCKFISFAVWWIRQNMLAAINNQRGIVRTPLNQQKNLNKFRSMQIEMMQNEQRDLTVTEFCEKTGCKEDMLQKIIEADSHAVSTDQPFGDDDDSNKTYGDMMKSDMNVDDDMKEESLHTDLMRVMSKVLKPNELTALKMMFGIECEPHRIEDIALVLCKSRERTRQICKDSLLKLQNSPYSSYLATYLAA